MRVTACELPHEPRALANAWTRLCEHASRQRSELVLLPEFAFVQPVWETERFDPVRWADIVAESDAWMQRLSGLDTEFVVGSRPVNIDDKPFNQGYLWSRATGSRPLRSKVFLPDEPGGWEGVRPFSWTVLTTSCCCPSALGEQARQEHERGLVAQS